MDFVLGKASARPLIVLVSTVQNEDRIAEIREDNGRFVVEPVASALSGVRTGPYASVGEAVKAIEAAAGGQCITPDYTAW